MNDLRDINSAMYKLILIGILATALAGVLQDPKAAPSCDPATCVLPDCRCSSTDIPGGLAASDIPQLVMFTFDDAVSIANFEYYQQAFFDKTNPDGCPIGSTYYVAHDYTDYTKVHDLHARGQEIALHSITHETMTGYWKDATVETLVAEFGGERELIAHFAQIPIEDIKGLRLPFLQMSGDNSFSGMEQIGLTFDSSWPSFQYLNPGIWPYTLDYASRQDCPIGPCPTESHPGTWVFPMIDWTDNSDSPCAMVDACQNVPEDVDGKFQFMVRNFERHYKGNRAPFGFYVHASWFVQANGPVQFEAYLKFIDYLQTLPDVYIVGVSRALEWVRNPQTIANLKAVWPECQPTYAPQCNPITCQLKKEDVEDRWMSQCTGVCPMVYPWLGNPLGQ